MHASGCTGHQAMHIGCWPRSSVPRSMKIRGTSPPATCPGSRAHSTRSTAPRSRTPRARCRGGSPCSARRWGRPEAAADVRTSPLPGATRHAAAHLDCGAVVEGGELERGAQVEHARMHRTVQVPCNRHGSEGGGTWPTRCRTQDGCYLTTRRQGQSSAGAWSVASSTASQGGDAAAWAA